MRFSLGFEIVVLCLLALVEPFSSQGAEWQVNPSLRLETWVTYDDNIYLTTDRSEEIDIIRRFYDLGESDLYTKILGDLSLDFSLSEGAERILVGSLDYEYNGRFFTTVHDENNFQQCLKTDILFMPDNPLSLRVYGGVSWDERKPAASYGQLDNSSYWLGLEGQYKLSDFDLAALGYEYGYRDYQISEARRTPSLYDYSWHRIFARYEKSFNSRLSGEAVIAYRYRDYDQRARFANGGLMPSRDREDEYMEAGLQMTSLLTSKTGLRLGYLYADKRSTGPYYRYDYQKVFAMLLQELTPNTELYAYVEHYWKAYDDQIAYKNPLFALTPNGSRQDRQWLGVLGIERQLTEHVSLAAEYTRMKNTSNDETSEFTANQYSLGMICHF